MKKILSALLAFCMLIGCFSLPVAASENHISIFVKNGVQGGNGSFDLPFGTFNEARDYIRKLKGNGKYPEGGVTVYFREGTFLLSDAIELDENDSGTETGPVVYRPWKDESVSFVGGAEIPIKDFKSVTNTSILNRLHPGAKDKIVHVNLKDYGVTEYGSLSPYGNLLSIYNLVEFPYNSSGQNELFFDGKRMTAARWPNEGEATIDKVLSTGTVMQTWRDDLPEFPEGWVPKEERIISEVEGPKFTMKDPLNEKPWNRWTEAKDPVLYGRLMWEWSDEGIPISIKSDGVITSDFPVAYGVKSLAHFYIWNLLEELDLPGEWYLDRESGELYFYPISDVNGNVLLSLLDKSIINIKNATHISFKNFRLEASKEHGINIVKSSNITVEGLSGDNPVTVTGDLGLITQALYNLIENAVKYTNVNGCISVSFSSENGFSVFSIRNTGAGISDDEKEKIFSKFYRSESAKKNQPDGTGLGLSITKAVVNLHNGTIYADGIPDGFAEFTVKLPS